MSSASTRPCSRGSMRNVTSRHRRSRCCENNSASAFWSPFATRLINSVSDGLFATKTPLPDRSARHPRPKRNSSRVPNSTKYFPLELLRVGRFRTGMRTNDGTIRARSNAIVRDSTRRGTVIRSYQSESCPPKSTYPEPVYNALWHKLCTSAAVESFAV